MAARIYFMPPCPFCGQAVNLPVPSCLAVGGPGDETPDALVFVDAYGCQRYATLFCTGRRPGENGQAVPCQAEYAWAGNREQLLTILYKCWGLSQEEVPALAADPDPQLVVRTQQPGTNRLAGYYIYLHPDLVRRRRR